MFAIIVRPELLNVSSVHLRFCILLGTQTTDYMKIIISNMNLLVIGIGREKDLIIRYRYL